MTLRRALGLLLMIGMLTAAVISQRDRQRSDRMNDTAAALRELAATRLAPAGSAPRAGISARAGIDVQPFPHRIAGKLHDDPDFHRLSHRCGVCHSTPDPALYQATEWPTVIARMSLTIDAAGLLPLSQTDSAAVLRALTKDYSRQVR
jgi:hypothetical protein